MIKVVNIKGVSVYPIFKNGKSAIEHYADEHKCKWLINEQCRRANPITVFLRKPLERFVSGVHTYLEFEKRTKNVDVGKTLLDIESGHLTNEHFMTQYEWLQQLHAYHKGIIVLKTVNDLLGFIPNREKPRIPEIDFATRDRILAIDYNLKKDDHLYNNYVGAHLPLGLLLERISNEVS